MRMLGASKAKSLKSGFSTIQKSENEPTVKIGVRTRSQEKSTPATPRSKFDFIVKLRERPPTVNREQKFLIKTKTKLQNMHDDMNSRRSRIMKKIETHDGVFGISRGRSKSPERGMKANGSKVDEHKPFKGRSIQLKANKNYIFAIVNNEKKSPVRKKQTKATSAKPKKLLTKDEKHIEPKLPVVPPRKPGEARTTLWLRDATGNIIEFESEPIHIIEPNCEGTPKLSKKAEKVKKEKPNKTEKALEHSQLELDQPNVDKAPSIDAISAANSSLLDSVRQLQPSAPLLVRKSYQTLDHAHAISSSTSIDGTLKPAKSSLQSALKIATSLSNHLEKGQLTPPLDLTAAVENESVLVKPPTPEPLPIIITALEPQVSANIPPIIPITLPSIPLPPIALPKVVRRIPKMKLRMVVSQKPKKDPQREYHPSFMSDIFPLPPAEQILFGPFEQSLALFSATATGNTLFLNQDKYIFENHYMIN